MRLIFGEDRERKESGRESKATLMRCKSAAKLIIRFQASRKWCCRAALLYLGGVEKSTCCDLRLTHCFFPWLHQICSPSYIDIIPSCALSKVAVGTGWICSFQIVLLVSVRSSSLFFAQSYLSSQSDLCQCYLHFKIEFAFYLFVTFASDSENKFCSPILLFRSLWVILLFSFVSVSWML